MRLTIFRSILEKYGDGRERRTELTSFEEIEAVQVVANNIKLYADLKEGFVGFGLKKDTFVTDCSDIDDIIVIREDGKMVVTRIADKTFVGKKILHVDVWRKNDERTTYNLIYRDGKTGRSFAKRFQVKAITRDKEYDLTTGTKGSKVLYLTSNPNGESEIVTVKLSTSAAARKKVFDFNFDQLAIKGRRSKGNILTKYAVRQIVQKEVGMSTLGAMKIWVDEVSGRINRDERGLFVGAFDTGDLILSIFKDGSYELLELDMNHKFDIKNIVILTKYREPQIISAVHYDPAKDWTLVKRFQIETSTVNHKFSFISEESGAKLYLVTISDQPAIRFTTTKGEEGTEKLADLVGVKGWKAMGNRICEGKLRKVEEVSRESNGQKLAPGDSLDLDVDQQGTLFDLDK